jgi:transposase
MARTGRPIPHLAVTDDERAVLERYVKRGKTAQNLALRSRIVLRCAEGGSNTVVAAELGVGAATVGKWRGRFVLDRLDGLSDAERPGPNRKITDEHVVAVIVKTLETMPDGASKWTTRDMARKAGMSHSSVGRIWRTFGIKPHLSETFQLSRDPDFIDKVRDVVGLYLDPPVNALVLATDEESQIQALNRTQPLLPLRPGQVERGTPEYERHGTTTLFAALDIATSHVIARCYARHRAIEFKKFLSVLDAEVKKTLDVHLILDNYATHKTPAVRAWLAKHPRFHAHFIPTHSSWLNAVEGWFGILTEKQMKRGSHFSVAELQQAIQEFLDAHNAREPRAFKWHKTADEILAKIEGLCERTLEIHGPTTSATNS